MAENKFKVFGESTTNILSDDSFSTDSEVTNGFQRNTTINSNTMNTILRQCSLISTVIADDIVSKESIDISPNMKYDTLKTNYVNYMDYKTKLGLNNLTSGIAIWSGNKFKSKKESTLDVASAVNVTTSINGKKISDIFESNDGVTVKKSTDVTSTINGKNISDIFDSDGIRVKNAINAINAINSANSTNATNSETTNKLSNFNNSSSGNKVEFSFGESSNKTTFTHTIPTVTSVQNSNNAINVTSTINGELLSDIFETDKTTVKEATHSKSADLATKSTISDSTTNVTTSINDVAISNIFESNGSTVKKATDSTNSEKVTKYIGEQLISDIFESNSAKVKNSSNSDVTSGIKGGNTGYIPYQSKANETANFISLPDFTEIGVLSIGKGKYDWKKESELSVASARSASKLNTTKMTISNGLVVGILKNGLYAIDLYLTNEPSSNRKNHQTIFSIFDISKESDFYITDTFIAHYRINDSVNGNYLEIDNSTIVNCRLITEY